jgi:hypothetical protein
MPASKKSSKSATKKSATKKAATKASKKATSGRKYSPASSAAVEREMEAMKEGKLRTGTGKKVTNPQQAIAIGLSEARREGDQIPPPPQESVSAKKTSTAAKKTSGPAKAK